jgi:CheY-like chemotaxis protein
MRRILVVDDNRDFADDLAEIFEHQGHQALACYSAQDALKHARGEPFDLALLDIRMPDMSGPELCEELLRAHAMARCVFMTGYSSEAQLDRARDLSGAPVLEKPINIDALIRMAAS